MMAGFPHKKSVRARLRHVWDTYVNWGVKNPQKRKVLAQLTFSGKKRSKSRRSSKCRIRFATLSISISCDLPMDLNSRTLTALGEATMDLMVLRPAKANKYRNSGFEVYWAGISRK